MEEKNKDLTSNLKKIFYCMFAVALLVGCTTISPGVRPMRFYQTGFYWGGAYCSLCIPQYYRQYRYRSTTYQGTSKFSKISKEQLSQHETKQSTSSKVTRTEVERKEKSGTKPKKNL